MASHLYVFLPLLSKSPLFWLSLKPNKNSFKAHFLLSQPMFRESRKNAPLRKNHNTITQNLCFSIHDWSRDGRLLLSFNTRLCTPLRTRGGNPAVRKQRFCENGGANCRTCVKFTSHESALGHSTGNFQCIRNLPKTTTGHDILPSVAGPNGEFGTRNAPYSCPCGVSN